MKLSREELGADRGVRSGMINPFFHWRKVGNPPQYVIESMMQIGPKMFGTKTGRLWIALPLVNRTVAGSGLHGVSLPRGLNS